VRHASGHEADRAALRTDPDAETGRRRAQTNRAPVEAVPQNGFASCNQCAMNERPLNVLFLCTGNSARSILCEVALNTMARGRFKAFSAGSRPTGRVNPLALELLRRNRLPTAGLRSKSWDEFAVPGAPALDFVFTVCDNAAGEVCPLWPGQPVSAHWGVEDPAAVEGDDETKRRAFVRAYATLARRIELFLALPLAKLDRLALTKKLDEIGRSSAATTPAPAA
jgi:arsenate reductase